MLCWSSSRSSDSLRGKYGSCTKPPEKELLPVQPTATFNLWYVIVTHNVLGVLIIISGTLSRESVVSAVEEPNQKMVLSLTSSKENTFSA